MIWLVGNNGMLGKDVEKLLDGTDMPKYSTDIDVDITDRDKVLDFATRTRPRWIINCAAYTAVDDAEDEEERAYRINAIGVENLALAARDVGATLLHMSTDYVFDGNLSRPYTENDTPNPIGAYGRTKLAGERLVRQTLTRHFIIRTAWLYGVHGRSFVRTMLDLFERKDEIEVVCDQWSTPTFAEDLAGFIVRVINANTSTFGTYHYTNEGSTNWYEFALAILSGARNRGIVKREVTIRPIPTEQYPTKAKRPRNAILSTQKVRSTFSVDIPDWRDGLSRYLDVVRRLRS